MTLDGTIMLVDNCDKPPMESIMWNLQVRATKLRSETELWIEVDHQLMCLSSLDVTGNGSPEVVSIDQSKASILSTNQSEASILSTNQLEASILSTDQ